MLWPVGVVEEILDSMIRWNHQIWMISLPDIFVSAGDQNCVSNASVEAMLHQ